MGSGYLARGNSNSSAAQEATTEYGTGYTDFTHKRTHILSNGQVIWDLAGNVLEWTNDTITGANQPTGSTPGFGWREFTTLTTYGTTTQQTVGPYNASWNSSQGLGSIYSDGTSSNSITYGFLRGGAWSYGTHAGVESLLLYYTPDKALPFIGFRCAR